jgi:hypothetical protein
MLIVLHDGERLVVDAKASPDRSDIKWDVRTGILSSLLRNFVTKDLCGVLLQEPEMLEMWS